MSPRHLTRCSGLALLCLTFGPARAADGPAFDCHKVADGSIAALICASPPLSALDRQLAMVYTAAARKAANEPPTALKAKQRGWIKGRDACWKSDDKTGCVREAYRQRIAELQARYRLVEARGPFHYRCAGQPGNALVVTFFATEPATLIAERGDSVSLMYSQPSGSGARYEGRNESFWEHHGEARVRWGADAAEMDCNVAR